MANLTSDYTSKTNGSTPDYKNKMTSTDFDRMAQTAGDKVGAFASDIANKASETAKYSRDYVKENPTKGIALAAATGVVVGSLLTMALRSKK